MSRTQNVSRNMVWGLLEQIVGLGIPFLMRTIMLYTLGELYLGLNGLFTSVLQVLNISELGISSAIVYSMYKPLAEGNDKEVCALLNLYKKCYRIIGAIVGILGLIIMPFIDSFISGEVPQDINIFVLYFMNLISTVLSYELFSHRTSLLIANQRTDVVSRIRTTIVLIQSAFQMGALVLLEDYYLYVAFSIIGTIINNIVAAIFCKKMYPQYYCEGNVSEEVYSDIKQKVKGMILQKIGGVVLKSVDTIIISMFLGLRILAVYQNYYFIITALFGILAIITNSLIATIGNSVALESVEKNYADFQKFNFMYIWIVSWCTICLLCLYQPFMEIWVGKELMLSIELVVLFAVYFFIHKWCDMLYVYQEACGIWWETKWVPLIAAIVNLVTNIILVQVIGLAGVLLSTIISILLIYDVGYAVVLFKTYFKRTGKLKEYIFKQCYYAVVVVFAAIITVYFCKLFVFSAFMQFVINGLVCVFLPNVIFFAIWHGLSEFKDSLAILNGIIKKKVKK